MDRKIILHCVVAGILAVTAQAQVVQINNADPATFVDSDYLADEVRFSGKVAPRIDAANLNKGLQFQGGGTLDLLSDVTANNFNDSIVLGSRANTTVRFNELMTADKSNDILLTLITGGRLLIGQDAQLDFINSAYFTRQFWVYGDGTGTLELAEQFVADRTQNGTVESGYGAIRLGHATLLTHHTQSLPEHIRPNATAGPGINGHMVFTEQPGGTWLTATHAQTYRGGVWIEQDITLHTDTDLTHTGVLNTWSDFTNHGAFQTLNPNLTLTKTGSASLILAGEQAYQSGATLDIQQGTVRFETDAVGGTIKSGAAGQHLAVQVADGAAVAFTAPLVRLRALTVNHGATLSLGDNSTLDVAEALTLAGGTLDLTLLEPASLTPLAPLDVIAADALSGTFAQVQGVLRNGGQALAVTYAGDAVRVTRATPGDASLNGSVSREDLNTLALHWQASGATWIEGDFNGDGMVNEFDLALMAAHWDDTQLSFATALYDAGLSIPEPGGLAGVLGGLASILLGHRGR